MKMMMDSILRTVGWLLGRPARTKPTKRLRVCIFKTDRLGDFVLAMGAIRLLTRRYGDRNCMLVLSKNNAELARTEFPNVPLIEVPAFGVDYTLRGFWECLNFRRLLGEYEFDQLVCLRHQRTSFQDLCLCWVKCRAKIALTNDIEGGRRNQFVAELSFCGKYPSSASPDLCLELEAHRIVLSKALGEAITSGDILPRLSAKPQSGPPSVLVCPFGTSPIREYPERLWCELLCQIPPEMPVRICCTEGQIPAAHRLKLRLANLGISQVETLRTPRLVDFVEAVANASLVITVETSTAHIATALDKATVVIIGGGHYGRFGPWRSSSRQAWVTHRMDCFGCGWECVHPSPDCITRIPVQELARLVKNAL